MNKMLKIYAICFVLLFITGCFGDKATKTVKFTEHALNINLSKKGQNVLISNSKGYVDLFDFSSFKKNKLDQWAHQQTAAEGIIAADFSSQNAREDDQYVVTASQKTIARYSMLQKKIINYWSLDNISALKLSSNGEFALVASAENKNDQHGKYLHYRLVYFHLPSGGIKYAFYHDDKISTIDLSADGRYAISGSDDTQARLWDLKTGELKYSWSHRSKVVKVKLSDDGLYAMTNNAAGEIKIYNTTTGKLYKKLKLPPATVSAAMFSANGKYLATGLSREQLILWDIKSASIIKQWYPARRYFWQSSLARVTAIAFLGNKKLLSITSRGIAQMWKF
ncbi:MAG: WD40 repeat domain-containing protein [Pseudomonadota bacterium]